MTASGCPVHLPDGEHPPVRELALLDILDPAFRPDSAAVRAAQDESWYAHTPVGLAVLRHAEVAALLKDRRLRQGAVSSLAVQGITEGPLAEWWRRLILNVEGEGHSRQRDLVRRAFTPRAVDALRPAMRGAADELVDAFAGRGRCEFMAAFADPFPARVFAELLGIAEAERERFRGWATDLGLAFGFAVAANMEKIEAALAGLTACVDDLLAARRAAPGPDLVSGLITAAEGRDGGAGLSEDELRVLVTGLVFAGQDTTRNQLGRAMALFLEHPEQWARLAGEPALAARAVEEIMRAGPTVPAIFRIATEDFEFQGLPIPAGAHLTLLVAAANDDPRVFDESGAPATFDITRERPAQLTFGGGVHFCLGAPLARAELQEALPILATRLRRPASDGPAAWRPALGITGPERLPIRFEPAPRGRAA